MVPVPLHADRPEPSSVCYVVLSHEEPDLVRRLIEVIVEESPGSGVFVRHDSSSCDLPARSTDADDGVRVLQDGSRAPWGSWELTAAALRAVRASLESSQQWRWLVLLSGTSYPIAPLRHFEAELVETAEDAVLSLSPPRQQAARNLLRQRPFGADRARYEYRRLPAWGAWEVPALRRSLLSVTGRQPWGGVSFHPRGPLHPRLTPHLVTRPLRPVFRRGLRPVSASQWWALSRSSAQTVVELLEPSNPWNRHFRRSYMSDETAVASYLAARGATVADRSLHAMWWPDGPSPAVISAKHLPWVSTREEPFVRKVSMRDGDAVLRALDEQRWSRAQAAPPVGGP